MNQKMCLNGAAPLRQRSWELERYISSGLAERRADEIFGCLLAGDRHFSDLDCWRYH
jgi:hypothetical protein